jgi:hypothetical protein
MQVQFEQGKICIQSNASEWGPFTFNLEDAIPGDKTILACTVKSYLGRVKPSDSDVIASETETTAELIGTTSVSSDFVVSVNFNRPTTEAWINAKHTLVFNFTLSGSPTSTHSAYFYQVEVL